MKFIAVSFLAVILLAGFYFLRGSSPSPASPPTPESTDTPQTGSISKYVQYSKRLLENSANKKRVLFFYANWCPICRPADAEFQSRMSEIPEDVVVLRVNYNDTETDAEEEALAEKYDITYQHTFVQIDEEGREIKKWNGGELDELLGQIN